MTAPTWTIRDLACHKQKNADHVKATLTRIKQPSDVYTWKDLYKNLRLKQIWSTSSAIITFHLQPHKSLLSWIKLDIFLELLNGCIIQEFISPTLEGINGIPFLYFTNVMDEITHYLNSYCKKFIKA